MEFETTPTFRFDLELYLSISNHIYPFSVWWQGNKLRIGRFPFHWFVWLFFSLERKHHVCWLMTIHYGLPFRRFSPNLVFFLSIKAQNHITCCFCVCLAQDKFWYVFNAFFLHYFVNHAVWVSFSLSGSGVGLDFFLNAFWWSVELVVGDGTKRKGMGFVACVACMDRVILRNIVV